MKLTNYIPAAVAAMGIWIGAGTVQAQNTAHNTGDLILAFQNVGGATGSDSVVLVSLGNAANLYRGQTASTLNIANVGTLLTNTFGANWWDSGTVSMSALSAWNSSGLNTSLLDGDPTRTVYVSQARTEAGVFGEAASVGWSGISGSNLSTAATRMLQVAGNLEGGGEGFALAISTSTSHYDDNNPFVGSNQGTAYTVFPGGTQYIFNLGNFGEFGGVLAEGVLDLYRFQARNDLVGQYGYGESNGVGAYQGSLAIDQNGNISYLAVPEPGSMILLGAAGLALVARRRFKKTVS